MRKSIIAIFFSTFFMCLLIAPSVIITIDSSIDVSMFFNLSEEEEEKESEKNKEFEIALSEMVGSDLVLLSKNGIENSIHDKFWNSKPYLKLDSPPPKPTG